LHETEAEKVSAPQRDCTENPHDFLVVIQNLFTCPGRLDLEKFPSFPILGRALVHSFPTLTKNLQFPSCTPVHVRYTFL